MGDETRLCFFCEATLPEEHAHEHLAADVVCCCPSCTNPPVAVAFRALRRRDLRGFLETFNYDGGVLN